MRKPESSTYIENERRSYALYVITNRALPAITDGLKAAARRMLWMARDGHKYKTAALAGVGMVLHPHGEASGSINTLTAPYGNNIPLFDGIGAFGTLINPTAYGASRYTSVIISKFTQDVIFKDIEIIPMMENYDGTLEEPVHFLPLIPTVLLNPTEGIAIGFATNILPRSLRDIIINQLNYLKREKIDKTILPHFTAIDCPCEYAEPAGKGIAYYFNGKYITHDTSSLTITSLPYGQTHEKVITILDKLIENDIVIDYTDRSKNIIAIDVKLKRGYLKNLEPKDILNLLGLSVRHIENLTVLDTSGQTVWNTDPITLIKVFTDWRLGFYQKRYQRLLDLLKIELQKCYDIRTAFKKDVSSIVRKTQTRKELITSLEEIKIIHTDYIADLPIYRFTEMERTNNELRITKNELQLKHYETLLSSEDERRKVYITDLTEVLTKYNKGYYTT